MQGVTRFQGWRLKLRELYFGSSATARRFRYGIIFFDLLTLLFVISTSFLPREPWIGMVDVAIGLALATEYIAHLAAHRAPGRQALRVASLIDLVAVLSFLAPLAGEGFAFLRVLRTLRLLHTYRTLMELREDMPFFRRHEEALIAGVHLTVFVFVMTALVYETQRSINPKIADYADALYFTVTALTTTGFGDITMEGKFGKMLSVFIMICGVTLFLRLAQALFRPRKVRFPCPSCGLQRHDPDAVHCKACGTRIAIPDEGRD
ncbi:MAG: potassium channel family protein [Roseomonas sp.]